MTGWDGRNNLTTKNKNMFLYSNTETTFVDCFYPME